MGLALLILYVVRSTTADRGGQVPVKDSASVGRVLPAVLLAWFLIPPLVGAVLAQRINATYFALGSPALLISAGVTVRATSEKFAHSKWMRFGALSTMVTICVVYAWFHLDFVSSVDRTRFVNSQYYIPLVNQNNLALSLAKNGVNARRLRHLSGDWYQRPYEYLLFESPESTTEANQYHWAVIEDLNLRKKQPGRAQFFQSAAKQWEGKTGIVFFPDPQEWNAFINRYYQIPIETQIKTTEKSL